MENHTDKKMENDMASGIIQRFRFEGLGFLDDIKIYGKESRVQSANCFKLCQKGDGFFP